MLGPLVFVIYINDLEENVGGPISKFVNDTNIGRLLIVPGIVRGYNRT